MIADHVDSAIEVLAALDAAHLDRLIAHWRRTEEVRLESPIERAADRLDEALPSLLDAPTLLDGGRGPLVLTWCAANAARSDVTMAPLLTIAHERPELRELARGAARDRVLEGPLEDALACAPLLGPGDAFSRPENAQARARMEILIWEAGASARSVPTLGAWIWGDIETFEAFVGRPARGSLRHRVLAARCLEVSVDAMPTPADPALVGRALQVLQPLLLHPEPLVWIHAARALGRLAGPVDALEGTLLDWVRADSPLLRQRALTAFASLPPARLGFLRSQLVRILETPDEEPWALAALAAATPNLFVEQRALWDRLATRILGGDGGAIAARALARGLATLWRRGMRERDVEMPMRTLRELARRSRASAFEDRRRFLEVIAVTDPIDGAERDPLDLELGIENLVRIAAQYDDEEADARAARFAVSLATAFQEAHRIALGKGTVRHRAAALNALEGCARSLALRLWGPLLATRPRGEAFEAPDLDEAWSIVARAPAELLDTVAELRREGASDESLLGLEVLAIRLGGYALDACGEDRELGPGRGPTAHETCRWLRKLEGLADGTRELPPTLQSALAALLWRLVDTTRGTSLGEVDDARWLGPFAAWWALVIDRPIVLRELATALPMMSEAALVHACDWAEALRTTMAIGVADGAWRQEAERALAELHAEDTVLARALSGLAQALERFSTARGSDPRLEARCLELVVAAERLRAALADPVAALHPASDAPPDDENAPRIAARVARAIRTRELSMLDVWFSSLGPVASALVEAATRGAVRRSPPPPPTRRTEPTVIEGYELVKRLGEGGVGSVWLVRKPGADRLFVLKIPKADALAQATDTEREGILASFIEEAKALAGLYHPNVASIIDRGVSGSVPFLVLELLIGADLKAYSEAKKMSLFELRQVVVEACAGLAALHAAGLVHRDVKPANLWLRLPLRGDEKFDPQKHRDPARIPPLATVLIDFGMVRAMRVANEGAGRFVAGTPGYMAPEQVLDPAVLDGRADVYGLAGTVYNVTTGRTFFDDIQNPRDRIIAHMTREPFEDAERLAPYPTAIAKLLRAATAPDWRDRPLPLEFSREFTAAL